MAVTGRHDVGARADAATLVDVSTGSGRLPEWGRRGFLLLLTVFVACGALGLLGVRTASTSSTGGGYDLTVDYASMARAGLDVPLAVTVHHPGGFGREVQLAITADYLDIFETQGFNPDPSDATRDGDTIYLTFAAPPGDTFRFSYDAYVQPSSQRGRDARVSVVEDGAAVASVSLTTHLAP